MGVVGRRAGHILQVGGIGRLPKLSLNAMCSTDQSLRARVMFAARSPAVALGFGRRSSTSWIMWSLRLSRMLSTMGSCKVATQQLFSLAKK